jgi:hypothetical protein
VANEYTVVTRWGAVDGTSTPAAFIEYLDTVSSLEAVQRLKLQTYQLLEAREGHHLLDLGSSLTKRPHRPTWPEP